MTIECKRCRYFNTKQGPGNMGQCRRMPPVNNIQGHSEWPDVKPTQWCGEFRPRVVGNDYNTTEKD